jgi:lipid II:glycine glycyltransferase (peptidoglycan interpeptide bridge formation enzyme)
MLKSTHALPRSQLLTLHVLDATREKNWNAFVTSHDQAHVLQTAEWGHLKSLFGWTVERIALTGDSETIISGAQILYRSLPVGLGKLAYVPKGPLVNWEDRIQTGRMIAALEQAARAKGAIALSIEPELVNTPQHVDLVRQAGFVPGATTIQPVCTLHVDLTPDEDAILAAMKSKTRYNIRLSARKGVTVRQDGTDGIKDFNQLMVVTAERNEFGIRPPAYYRSAWDLFKDGGSVGLFLADYDGEPLAGVMAFALKDTAWYFFGASSDRHRNLMAPYAVQWAAIRWAKAKGCKTYDLWGIPDADEKQLEEQFTQRSDGLWGVYRFKRGFGGALVRTVGAWDRVLGPLRYRLYRLALNWRSRE